MLGIMQRIMLGMLGQNAGLKPGTNDGGKYDTAGIMRETML